ncbi:MAG: nitroreductase family protein [Chloroflexi bacterium]|nr:nitroreductase family protein [Chloroflexota bacterium]
MTEGSSAIEVLLEVMRQRKNTRRFKPDPVPDEYIETIIEAGRLAPSGANSQPWEFIVVRDPERKRQMAEIMIEAIKKGTQIDPKFPQGTDAMMRHKVADAPVLLAVCADTRFTAAYPGYSFPESILYVSIGCTMEHIHLAATALGLAICWGTTNQFSLGPIGEVLGVQPPLVVKEVFSIGFPMAMPPAKHRRDVREVTHYERLDVSKVRTDEDIAEMLASRRVVDVYSGRLGTGE